jgi:hypothetical protein
MTAFCAGQDGVAVASHGQEGVPGHCQSSREEASVSNKQPYDLENLRTRLAELRSAGRAGSPELVKDVEDYIGLVVTKLARADVSWHDFSAFWPPRCVTAFQKRNAFVFFGAGLSLSSGIPSWSELLSRHFGLEKALVDDDELAHDPLTLAELASQYLGSEVLQRILREVMNKPRSFSVGHAILAALRCPLYVTTNYDRLFEQAWQGTNPSELAVVTTDADMAEYDAAVRAGRSVLFKIHGCAGRDKEYLILTRKDYRFHYRKNDRMFNEIKRVLGRMHTVFVGFSHRDPEVSRLVEDSIYEYEKEGPRERLDGPRPQFYSLQFDMKSHAPEVFAARGIVALQPPPVAASIERIRDMALSVALVDLLAASQRELHSKVSLDSALDQVVSAVSRDIAQGLQLLQGCAGYASTALQTEAPEDTGWLAQLLARLGPLASQGIYLVDDQGHTVAHRVPDGLDEGLRRPKGPLSNRPYFQQAKSFREPFLSDTVMSIFNGNSTFFVCLPILKDGQSLGLLFSAAQVGQWKTPLEQAAPLWEKNMSLSLIDSNGICLFPPRNEFATRAAGGVSSVERTEANVGYSHERLVELSRRDLLVRHLSRSVVPVTQDDDVLELARDLKEFSVVAEVPRTRWKVAVSIPVSVPVGGQR